MTQQGVLAVAVIGAGAMGADHARRLTEVTRGARVAAVADLDPERAKPVADGIDGCTPYTDPAAAIAAPGVEAVLIASPGPAHEEALLAALARGLPVLCEKPMTPDPAAALRVLEAEQRLGRRRIQVGFMRRYDRDFRELKALLDAGSLGRPLMLHCRHRNPSAHPSSTDATLISDSVVHETDATRWLLDQEITAVTVLRPKPSSAAPPGLSDPQLVLFETDAGVLVDVEMFATCGFGYQVQAEAVCEHGTARLGEPAGGIASGFLQRFRPAYDAELQAWVDASRRGQVTGPSAWDGYAAAAVSEAGIRAQTEGRRVAVIQAERPAFYR